MTLNLNSNNNNEQESSERENATQFKILILGDSGVGKTTYLKRLKLGIFDNKFTPTLDVKVYSLSFYTNVGKVIYNCYDIGGEKGSDILRNGKYSDINAAIIMFDVTSLTSYKSVVKWYQDLTLNCKNIPIVLCGNKVDKEERTVKSKHVLFHRKHPNMQYYDMSAKSAYNCEKVFLWITRKIFGSGSVKFVLEEECIALSKENKLEAQLVMSDQ